MFGNMIANMMIKPGSSPVFDIPSDYGLDYEDVTFKAKDGVELSGWLIKGSSNKIVIQSHFGVQCSRSGFTPKNKGLIKAYGEDIHFLNQAKYLVEAGYSVLMYDFRNHGNSAKGKIPWVTWGKEEAKDVVAAVDFISNHSTYKDASIGLLSICMGAGSSTVAYGLNDGLKNYENVKAMIAVQPLTYEKFVKAFGIPNFMLKSGNKEIKKRTNINFMESSFVPNVKDISVPTLVIQNENDPMTDKNLIENYYNDLQVEKKMLWVDMPKHKNNMHNRLEGYNWLGKNSKEVLSWFGKHL